jgi:hypothetical protein
VRRKQTLDWRDMETLAAECSRESIDRLRDCRLAARSDASTRAYAIRSLIDAGQMSGGVPEVQVARLLEDSADDEMPSPVLHRGLARGCPQKRARFVIAPPAAVY